MSKVTAAIFIVIAIGLLLFLYFFWGSSVPAGQQPLVHLNNENFGALKNQFNNSSNEIRVLVMLSPT